MAATEVFHNIDLTNADVTPPSIFCSFFRQNVLREQNHSLELCIFFSRKSQFRVNILTVIRKFKPLNP